MRILKAICWILALILMLFTIIPFFHGVFNIGSAVLFGLAIYSFLFPIFWGKFKTSKSLQILLVSITAAVLSGVIVLSALMIRQAYFRKPPPEGEYTVIVLGAKVVGRNPSLTLKFRLDKAAEYLQQNLQATCIVSGGQGADESYPEGQVMKEYLERKGISSDRIVAEINSTNTRENLRFSKVLIPESSQGVVIVSDNFHQLRASITAKSIGMQPIYSISSRTLIGVLPAYWMRDLCGVPLTWIEETFINK